MTFAWLAQVKADAAIVKQAEAIWDARTDRPVLDRVVETLALADADARDLVQTIRDPASPAPTGNPEVLTDVKRSEFLRHNLGLYYARVLAHRRVHEQVLQALDVVRPEKTVDPAAYFFFRAVSEHKLQKKEALTSIDRLLNTVQDAPERYTIVAMMMKAEMAGWKPDDMGYIARAMDDLARRFDLARGGKENQIKQEEVIARLAKMIEEMEKQC
jgi:hypothetical protein